MNAQPSQVLAQVLAQAAADFPATVERLKGLVRIPSCSFAGFEPRHLRESAEATAEWLRVAGYPDVRVVGFADAPPYVIAKDHRAGPTAPTVLLYAHHDVQPPLRHELWHSPAFEPSERDGRLYGRGSADDKAGIALHAAAAAAWNTIAGKPPINLTVVIEGEEEVNSPHFSQFLAAHKDELAADCLVIADLVNLDTGLPTLTTSLRGLVAIEVELRALKSPLHSGLWGGVVPDPALGLCRLLARLTNDDGQIAILGIGDDVRPLRDAERADFARVPFDAAHVAAQAGVQTGTLAVTDGTEHHARLWRRPVLSVNAIQSGTRGQTGNVVMDVAWARVGIRIVPDQQASKVLAQLTDFLSAHAPTDMELTIKPVAAGEPWATTSEHPAFDAARRALEMGYGVRPVEAGCGASVPFVGEMSRALGGVPALLLGVEDPICGAHAENESVHLGDLLKAISAEAALFGLLAEQHGTR